nr:hypothetical protein [Bacillota bacterium]
MTRTLGTEIRPFGRLAAEGGSVSGQFMMFRAGAERRLPSQNPARTRPAAGHRGLCAHRQT